MEAKAAAKQYHDEIRQQKKTHWNAFLADNDNIWKAEKYLKPGNDAAFGKVPQLLQTDGMRTTSNKEQALELMATFFPPLSDKIECEDEQVQREPVPMAALTIDEVEKQLSAANAWKAPGDDGIPMVVWKHV